MNINDKFKTSVNSTKEAEANIIELLKPVYERERLRQMKKKYPDYLAVFQTRQKRLYF